MRMLLKLLSSLTAEREGTSHLLSSLRNLLLLIDLVLLSILARSIKPTARSWQQERQLVPFTMSQTIKISLRNLLCSSSTLDANGKITLPMLLVSFL